MSDYKPNIYANFLNRKSGKVITAVPVVNNITINKDIRQLTDSFEFDFSYNFDRFIEIDSHDFVEFYLKFDDSFKIKNNLDVSNNTFQICCGYVEDFVKETSGNKHHFQGNGRDFLGHLLHIPFLIARPMKQTTLLSFTEYCISDSYLKKYLERKQISRTVIDKGAYPGTVTIPQLSGAKKGPVLQQTADEVLNIIYQNRFGQAVVWGRSSLNEMQIPYTLSEYEDPHVKSFVLRENYSKVISECKIYYTGGETGIDYASSPSQRLRNSETKATEIFQPEIRTFQTDSLVTTGPAISLDNRKDLLAQSLIRKSNQNLEQVIIKTHLPFYVTKEGEKIGYEVNQVWNIYSLSFDIDKQMRLVGINYHQTDSAFEVELLFIGKDTLV